MAHRSCRYAPFSISVLVCLILSTAAFATSNPDRMSWGHNLSIGSNEEVSDVTCIACSIYIRGQVSGDATTVGGSIRIEDQGQVAGDVTVVGGALQRDSETSISGDVTSVGGRGWVIPILLAPFVILGLLIALVVWLVQRIRRPSIPPVPA
jgi:hypothetical protein